MLRPLIRFHRLFLLAAGLLLLTGGRAALAQTGAALLVKPWPDKNEVFDGSADAYFFNSGHTLNNNDHFQLFDYESTGRFRILPGNEISPRIGYEALYLDNHTRAPGLPDQLSDTSLAIGTGIAKWDGNWVAGITLGVGYAGSSAFESGSAWYGKADLVVAKQISDNDFLGLILDYDGHRTYFPDCPLPGFGYSHRFDPHFQIVAGVPFSSVTWKPIDPIDVELEYNLLTDLQGSFGYEFIRHVFAYGSFTYLRDAFHAPGLARDHRLLFYEQRVEAGFRYEPNDHLKFKAGVGYEWDGSYRSGFDFRKDTKVEAFSDEPYLRIGIELNY